MSSHGLLTAEEEGREICLEEAIAGFEDERYHDPGYMGSF